MTKARVLIIDDEPLALSVIENYCKTIDSIELVGLFLDPMLALKYITSNPVDLIISDINMPNLTGIDLIASLPNKPVVIFTTAHSDYAVAGFELEALDYLLKPISYPRFLKSINRYFAQNQKKVNSTSVDLTKIESTPNNSFIFVKSEYENLKVTLTDILYIEGFRDYLKIFLTNGKSIMTLSSFSAILVKLPESDFIRVHNSFIVNLCHITSVQKNRIVIGQKRIPISETYKKSVFLKLSI